MAKVQKGAADAAARLIAKYGKAAVQRAIKAANTPAKGKKAAEARARGKEYQSGVNREVNWRQNLTKTSYREGGPTMRQTNPSFTAKSDKEFAAMKTRSKINKARRGK